MGRWDYLYEARPRPAVDVLLDEVAKAYAEELTRWPLPLEAADPADAALLSGARPHDSVFTQAFRLTRLDLMRAFDELRRWENEGWRAAQLLPLERDQARFLSRYLAELLFSLNDQLRTPLTRPQLCDLTERIELRLRAPSLIV